MCDRFRLTSASKLAERFAIEPEYDWVPRYNMVERLPEHQHSFCIDGEMPLPDSYRYRSFV
jgi:hypothetical protein